MGQIVGVYKISNLRNGKVYIGSSSDIARRWNVHRRFLKNGCHSNAHLQRAWDKYGEDAFAFDVVEITEKSELLRTEQRYIDTTRCFLRSCGYNLLPEAGRPNYSGKNHPMFGKKHSEATRQRMSIAHKTADANAWKYKSVEQLSSDGSVLAVFPSLQIAAKSIGVSHTSGITRVANGQRKQAHGFGWRYN